MTPRQELKLCLASLRFLIEKENRAIARWGYSARIENWAPKKPTFLFLYKLAVFASPRIPFITTALQTIITHIAGGDIMIERCGRVLVYDHANGFIKKKIFNKNKADHLIRPKKTSKQLLTKDFWALFFFLYRCCRPINIIEQRTTAHFIIAYTSTLNAALNRKAVYESFVGQDDLSPQQLGIMAALKKQRSRIAIARVNSGLGRNKPPFKIEGCFCWNQAQADEVFFADWISELRLPTQHTIKRIPKKSSAPLTIGVLLASKTSAFLVTEQLKVLNKAFRNPTFHVRPHPGGIFKSATFKDKAFQRLHICKPKEPLEDFVARVDLCITGNSSAAKEALAFGCPVVYVNDLDFNGYDYHGWVRRGLIYDGRRFNLKAEDINSFYQNPRWREEHVSDLSPPEQGISAQTAITYLLVET